MRRTLTIISLTLLLGCGAREEIVLQHVEVARAGWDSLIVSASFASQTTLGGQKSIEPDWRNIIVYNAAYDTLYAGSDSVIAISDAELGNEERLLVEICGHVMQLVVCEQHPTLASPKRIRLEPDIQYPVRKAVHQGQYRLPFVVERLQFGEPNSWEKVERTARVKGHLQAYVEGKEEEAIHVPFKKDRGGFNLANYANYKDFKYYLDSALLDQDQANVRFDVYVDMDGFYEPVGSIAKAVSVKTEEEHQEDVARLAEQATEQIVDRLNPFLKGRRNTVYIDRWNYNTFKEMYQIQMEIKWSGSLFTRSNYELTGVLEVYEGGQRAQFHKTDGNRRAERRWKSRIDGTAMTLYPLHESAIAAASNLASAPFQSENGRVIIEAEHFAGSRSYKKQSWQHRDRRGARGDGAVVALPNKNARIRSGYDEKSPELTYPIDFKEKGVYFVWLRVWAEDENSDTAHMGLNGTAFRTTSSIEATKLRRWHWTRKLSKSRDPASIKVFNSGIRTLNLWMREDGLYVDRILLTTDRSYIPSGNGPNESRRGGRGNADALTADS